MNKSDYVANTGRWAKSPVNEACGSLPRDLLRSDLQPFCEGTKHIRTINGRMYPLGEQTYTSAKHTVQNPETNGYTPHGVPKKNASTMHCSHSVHDTMAPSPYMAFKIIKSTGHKQSKLVQAQMMNICTALTSKPIVNHLHRCIIIYMGTFGIRRDPTIKSGCRKIMSS